MAARRKPAPRKLNPDELSGFPVERFPILGKRGYIIDEFEFDSYSRADRVKFNQLVQHGEGEELANAGFDLGVEGKISVKKLGQTHFRIALLYPKGIKKRGAEDSFHAYTIILNHVLGIRIKADSPLFWFQESIFHKIYANKSTTAGMQNARMDLRTTKRPLEVVAKAFNLLPRDRELRWEIALRMMEKRKQEIRELNGMPLSDSLASLQRKKEISKRLLDYLEKEINRLSKK